VKFPLPNEIAAESPTLPSYARTAAGMEVQRSTFIKSEVRRLHLRGTHYAITISRSAVGDAFLTFDCWIPSLSSTSTICVTEKMSCTDTAAAPLWQSTFENSRSLFRAGANSAAPAQVVATASAPQKAASPRATRGSTGARHHEPGHDLAAHGDLERHCGTPWFS